MEKIDILTQAFNALRVNGIVRTQKDFAIQVTGDSMSPEYPIGSQIIIKKISAEFIAWGNVFCLDTDDGAVIKQVFPTEDEGVIECRSLNPAYTPFKVKRDLINGWYRVLMCLSLK